MRGVNDKFFIVTFHHSIKLINSIGVLSLMLMWSYFWNWTF